MRVAQAMLSGVLTVLVLTSLQAQDRRAGVGVPASNAPGGASGPARIYAQVMHVRFTSPVMSPGPAPNGGESEVRARLESPVLAAANGATQKAVVIPAGIDVNIQVRLTSCCNARPTNSRLHLQIMSANVDPAEGRRRFFSAPVTHDYVGWPKADEVLIPQNATLSFPLSNADPDPSPGSGDDSFASRPLLEGSSFRVALVDEPIDSSNAGADKLFRAQLTEDMVFRQGQNPLPSGAIKLTKGTEVWVRSYEPDPEAQLGHAANMSVDFVVINGKRIPVRTTPDRRPFQPGAMALSPDGKGRVPQALWPVGQPRQHILSEQQEVATNGATLWTYPAHPNKPEDYRLPPGSPAGPVPQTSTASPPDPVPQPSTPPPAPPSADEARKRAQEIQACMQRAIAEHPRGDPALAQAFAACNQRK